MKYRTKILLGFSALALAASASAAGPSALAWTIGPITPTGNKSRGVPLHPV